MLPATATARVFRARWRSPCDPGPTCRSWASPTRGDAGRGFPWALKADYVDPDEAESHRALVDWGDGQSGADVPISEEEDEGPFLNRGLGRGTVTGRHTYDAIGTRSLRVCVNDKDALEGCATADVEVKDLIDLEVFNTLAEDLEQSSGDPGWSVGDELDFTIRVANRKPRRLGGTRRDER